MLVDYPNGVSFVYAGPSHRGEPILVDVPSYDWLQEMDRADEIDPGYGIGGPFYRYTATFNSATVLNISRSSYQHA